MPIRPLGPLGKLRDLRDPPGRIGVKARDVLIVLAESAAEVLAASLRGLSNMKPDPAARALAATYDRHANELAEIEAAYRNGTGSPVR